MGPVKFYIAVGEFLVHFRRKKCDFGVRHAMPKSLLMHTTPLQKMDLHDSEKLPFRAQDSGESRPPPSRPAMGLPLVGPHDKTDREHSFIYACRERKPNTTSLQCMLRPSRSF